MRTCWQCGQASPWCRCSFRKILALVFVMLTACSGEAGGNCYGNHTCDGDNVCVWWGSDSRCIPFDQLNIAGMKPAKCACDCEAVDAGAKRGWR